MYYVVNSKNETVGFFHTLQTAEMILSLAGPDCRIEKK